MSAPIAVTLPEPLRVALEDGNESVDLSRWTLEALVLEAVREGLISRGRGGELLGLGFHQREELFARRGVTYDLSEEELRKEQDDLQSIFGS
jgi:predicted HTH domain antitoxin